jgi:hypothetical protein
LGNKNDNYKSSLFGIFCRKIKSILYSYIIRFSCIHVYLGCVAIVSSNDFYSYLLVLYSIVDTYLNFSGTILFMGKGLDPIKKAAEKGAEIIRDGIDVHNKVEDKKPPVAPQTKVERPSGAVLDWGPAFQPPTPEEAYRTIMKSGGPEMYRQGLETSKVTCKDAKEFEGALQSHQRKYNYNGKDHICWKEILNRCITKE